MKTTPQTFISDARIGGFDDLSAHFGKATPSSDATTYKPVIALFSVAALMAVAVTLVTADVLFTGRMIEWFISISIMLLGLQKLQDVERFATMCLHNDLLAQRWVWYGYVYPFVETGAGLLMMAGVLTWLSAPAALFVASIGRSVCSSRSTSITVSLNAFVALAIAKCRSALCPSLKTS